MISETELKAYLQREYPKATEHEKTMPGLVNILTKNCISLKQGVYKRIEKSIEEIFAASRSEAYLTDIKTYLDKCDIELLENSPKNLSALMAYDYHYDEETDQLSLIEINTNASAYLITDLHYRMGGDDCCTYPWLNARQNLMDSFKQEAELNGYSINKIAIIDEHLTEQKMFFEFLLYKEFFQKYDIEAKIFDFKDVPTDASFNFIYNRFNDFTLTREESTHLRKAFLEKSITFSPNPTEYIRLADKRALQYLAKHSGSDVFIPMILFEEISDWDEMWSKRKKYVFKPQRMYGAKAVYRGSSISRKKFEEIKTLPFLAQEYRPPGKFQDMKYDLRFYAYQDKIQLAAGRIFQGQVLNFSHPQSGISCLKLQS